MSGELERVKDLREKHLLEGCLGYAYEIATQIQNKKDIDSATILKKITEDAQQIAGLLAEKIRYELILMGVGFSK